MASRRSGSLTPFRNLWLTVIFLFGGTSAMAAPGDLDPTFAVADGLTDSAKPVLVLADNLLIVAGDFTSYDNQPRKNIARLLPTGSVDPTFDPGAGPDGGTIRAVLALPNGKFLVGGAFTTFAGVNRPPLVRLNSNGSVDEGFEAEIEASDVNSSVETLTLQPNGNILISGKFRNRGETKVRLLVRLDANGAIDDRFEAPIGGTRILDVATKNSFIVICGDIQSENDPSLSGLIRLHLDGDLEAGFRIAPSGNLYKTVTIQENGSVIAGGPARLTRYLADGAVDTTFAPGFSTAESNIEDLVAQPDGMLLVAGHLRTSGSTTNHGVLRISKDGVRDLAFNSGPGGIHGVKALAYDPLGSIVVAGSFTQVNGMTWSYLARLRGGAGLIDGAGLISLVAPTLPAFEGKVARVGVVRAGGNSTAATISYTLTPATAGESDFLPSDGSLDFAEGETYKAILIPIVDDSAVEGYEDFAINLTSVVGGHLGNATAMVTILDEEDPGRFTIERFLGGNESEEEIRVVMTRDNGTYGSVSVEVRTADEPNGTFNPAVAGLDYSPVSTTVTFEAGENRKTFSIPVFDDTLKEGLEYFSIFMTNATNGAIAWTGPHYAAIYDSDNPGSLAPGFSPAVLGPGNPAIRSAVELADGKLLVGDGVGVNALIRLHRDGALDGEFQPNLPALASVNQIVRQPDGRILLTGAHLREGDNVRHDLIRLNEDGTLDPGFTCPGPYTGNIRCIALQPDGKVIAAGFFNSFGGEDRTHLVRLQADGSVDLGFRVEGASSMIETICVQPDGKILAGGRTAPPIGNQWPGLVRLHPGGERDTEFLPNLALAHSLTHLRALSLQPDGSILDASR